MQSNDMKILPGQTVTMPCAGTGFWFESGTSTTTDVYVIVKPDTGAEFTLKPGQHVQDPANPVSTWRITAHDPTATITGRVIIGNGDFGDSNVNNTFKLDGTFTNSVTVNNTTAAPVPVQIQGVTPAAPLAVSQGTGQVFNVAPQAGQTFPVSIAGTVTVAGSTVNYTNSFVDATTAAATATAIFTPAQNPNGAYIEFAEISACLNAGVVGGYFCATLLAKAGAAPANATDGDAVMVGMLRGVDSVGGSMVGPSLNQFLPVRIKIAAGKGLYLNQTVNNPDRAVKTVLYTLL